jgi:hypothetical protein
MNNSLSWGSRTLSYIVCPPLCGCMSRIVTDLNNPATKVYVCELFFFFDAYRQLSSMNAWSVCVTHLSAIEFEQCNLAHVEDNENRPESSMPCGEGVQVDHGYINGFVYRRQIHHLMARIHCVEAQTRQLGRSVCWREECTCRTHKLSWILLPGLASPDVLDHHKSTGWAYLQFGLFGVLEGRACRTSSLDTGRCTLADFLCWHLGLICALISAICEACLHKALALGCPSGFLVRQKRIKSKWKQFFYFQMNNNEDVEVGFRLQDNVVGFLPIRWSDKMAYATGSKLNRLFVEHDGRFSV